VVPYIASWWCVIGGKGKGGPVDGQGMTADALSGQPSIFYVRLPVPRAKQQEGKEQETETGTNPTTGRTVIHFL
jgi:hypothetical protein